MRERVGAPPWSDRPTRRSNHAREARAEPPRAEGTRGAAGCAAPRASRPRRDSRRSHETSGGGHAVRPEEPENLAAVHLEVEARDNSEVAVGLDQALDLHDDVAAGGAMDGRSGLGPRSSQGAHALPSFGDRSLRVGGKRTPLGTTRSMSGKTASR